LTETHKKIGRTYVAAPVFGRPEAAAAAKLLNITAAPDSAIARSAKVNGTSPCCMSIKLHEARNPVSASMAATKSMKLTEFSRRY
jgi:hypothetical protein